MDDVQQYQIIVWPKFEAWLSGMNIFIFMIYRYFAPGQRFLSIECRILLRGLRRAGGGARRLV